MAQSLEVAASDGAICKLTKTCQDLFERCMQTDRLSVAGWLEKRQGMFNLWSFVLKVSETGKQSLDYHLRPRPDTAEVIKDLIEGLLEALEQCKEIADELDSHGIHEQAGSLYPPDQSEGSRDGQSPFWSEEEGDGDDGDDGWRDPFSQQKLYITSLVDHLRRISTAIRKSGIKYRYERADKEFNEDSFQELRNSMAIAIRRQQLWQPKAVTSEAERYSTVVNVSLSEANHGFSSEVGSDFQLGAKPESQRRPQNHPQPGAGIEALRGTQVEVQAPCRQLQDTKSLTPVQERLVRANILRHHRITFFVESARKKAMLLAYRDQCEGQEPERKKAKLIGAGGNDQAIASVAKLGDGNAPMPSESGKPVSQAENPSRSQAGLSQAPITTAIASGLDIKEVIRPKWSPSQVMAGTVTQETQDYPRCPKALADGPAKGMIQCPYCAEILPGEYVKGDKRWRSHVVSDLIPYMCVFENCNTPDEMYASTFELTQHTVKAHGAPYWICEYCPAESAGGIMESPLEWDAHMREEHPGGFREAELPLLCDASRQTLIPPVACPLCHTCRGLPSETLDAHIAKHLHAFALLSLPWGNTEGAESDSDTNAAMRPTLGADRSPGEHKALHEAPICAWLDEIYGAGIMFATDWDEMSLPLIRRKRLDEPATIMENAQNNSVGNNSNAFHRFERLPTELRRFVWLQHLGEAASPAIYRFKILHTVSTLPKIEDAAYSQVATAEDDVFLVPMATLKYDYLNNKDNRFYWDKLVRSTRASRAALAACPESRQIALGLLPDTIPFRKLTKASPDLRSRSRGHVDIDYARSFPEYLLRFNRDRDIIVFDTTWYDEEIMM
ncbi:hypothetical protein RB595_008294 [Gaeumannomyces hyphopodioides]